MSTQPYRRSISLMLVQFSLKRTGHHVVGDDKTSVTMVLNKNLWLEINANTSSNERMPARHRSLWRDWLCSLQFVSVLYSSHKYPQLKLGYGSFFATYNMVHCSLSSEFINYRKWWSNLPRKFNVVKSVEQKWKMKKILTNLGCLWGGRCTDPPSLGFIDPCFWRLHGSFTST